MDTRTAPTIGELTTKLGKELRYYSMDKASSTGATVVACFQNVVCVDFRMNPADLDPRLQAIFTDAKAKPGGAQDLQLLANKIEGIGRSS